MSSKLGAGRRTRGFSLIELLVAVIIGLAITLVIFRVLSDSEARKRTSTSANDANQAGAYATYVLDRTLRSAGSGFLQGWARVGGCQINASLAAGVETWPRAAALPAPFAAIPQTLRLAPVVIFEAASDAGSDVLMVMSGAAGFGEAPTLIQPGAITAAQVQLPNTIGFRANDLVMLAGGGQCLLSQVSAAKVPCAGDPGAASPTTLCSQALPLGGAFYAPAAGATSLAALAGLTEVSAFAIGNPVTNPPQFQLIGVGDNSTLFRHDLLLLNGNNDSQPVAEGVRELHAVYGLDTDDDGILDAWQRPTTGTNWDGARLMDGSAASATRLRQIVAVRIGLVMRSSLVERELDPGVPVAPPDLTLFADLPAAAQVTVDLTRAGENRNQRHRTIEVTVPVRNLLMRTS